MSDFFEFTDSGIRFKGFQELRTTLENAWKQTFGTDIDLSPTSPDGHHVDLECRAINSVSEGLEILTTMLNRQQARGQFLNNLAAFLKIERNDGESDDELRKRMDAAETEGLATFDGMTTYLMDKIGSDISLSVNEESEEQDGMSPHSIRVTVPTSNPKSSDVIAAAIWHCKPAGIKTCGNNSGVATDASGRSRVVRFSRPQSVQFDIKVELELYSEESFPSGGIEAVEKQIRDWASGNGDYVSPAYVPGTDVIPLRIVVPVLSVGGIENAVISVKLSTVSSWSGDIIRISSEEIATVKDVEVIVVK